MALTITTWSSGYYSCPVGYASVNITGSNIVSIGVQTDGNQQNFSIVQDFVGSGGSGGYVQVANNGFADTIDYQVIVVQAFDYDTGDVERPKSEHTHTPKAK